MHVHTTWIQAVAGSGKTSGIVSNITSLLRTCGQSGDIWCLSFSRSTISSLYAAVRAAQQVTDTSLPEVRFATVHSIAASILGDVARYAPCVMDLTQELASFMHEHRAQLEVAGVAQVNRGLEEVAEGWKSGGGVTSCGSTSHTKVRGEKDLDPPFRSNACYSIPPAKAEMQDAQAPLTANVPHESTLYSKTAAGYKGLSRSFLGGEGVTGYPSTFRTKGPEMQDAQAPLTANVPHESTLSKIANLPDHHPPLAANASHDRHASSCLLYETFGVLSYDHLLTAAIAHLHTHTMRNPPRHIFVDEAQDLSAEGWALLECVIKESDAWHGAVDVYVVGDPNQIIYQFQGASRSLWELWQKRLGGLGAVSAHCYRCSAPVIDVINALYTPCHTHKGAAGWIKCAPNTSACSAILELRRQQVGYADIMILVRHRGARLERLVSELRAQGVPVSGLTTTLDQAIALIRPFVAVVSSTSPQDCDLAEILYALYSPADVSQALIERNGSVYNLVCAEYPALRKLLERLDKHNCVAFLELLGEYVPVHPDLFGCAARYAGECGGHIDGFVDYCSAQALDTEPVSGCARLLTIHGAKGLQAKYVVIADATEAPRARAGGFYVDGKFCDETEGNAELGVRAIQEVEDNLLYVALTRAECGVLLCGEGGAGPGSFLERVQRVLDRQAGESRCK